MSGFYKHNLSIHYILMPLSIILSNANILYKTAIYN